MSQSSLIYVAIDPHINESVRMDHYLRKVMPSRPQGCLPQLFRGYARECLKNMLEMAGRCRIDGNLGSMSADGLAEVCNWMFEPADFLDALLEAGWLVPGENPDELCIEGWERHSGRAYAKRKKDRLDQDHSRTMAASRRNQAATKRASLNEKRRLKRQLTAKKNVSLTSPFKEEVKGKVKVKEQNQRSLGGGDPARSSAPEPTRHPPPPPVALGEPVTPLYSSQGPDPTSKVTQPACEQQRGLQEPFGVGVLATRQAPPRQPVAPALNALRKRIAVGPDGQEPEPPTGKDPYCRTTAQRPRQTPEILAAHTLRMDGDATAPDDAPLRLADLVKLFCETYTVKLGHTVTQNELKMMRELEAWHVTQTEALLAYEDARQYAANQGDKPGLTLILFRLKKLAGRRAAQDRGVDTGQVRVQDKTDKQRAYEMRQVKDVQDLQAKAQALEAIDRIKADAKRSRS